MTSNAVAWLFPGQGSQSVGMGRDLWEQSAAAVNTFTEADQSLDFALSELMFGGPKEQLDDTINTQPALYVHSIAAFRAAQEAGVLPAASYAAGHSLGEYSALVAVGALSFSNGLRLVRERGRLMKEAGIHAPGSMAAILGLDDEVVAAICAASSTTAEPVQVANYNCPGQVVISGAKAAVERAMEALTAAKARRVVPLDISIAAHSPLMAPAQAELDAFIDTLPIAAPSIPLIGNVTAAPLTTAADIRAELKAQLTGAVQWTATVQALAAQGVSTVLEIGSGEVLVGLTKRIDKTIQRHTVGTWADIQTLRANG